MILDIHPYTIQKKIKKCDSQIKRRYKLTTKNYHHSPIKSPYLPQIYSTSHMLSLVGFDNNFDKSRLMKSTLYVISLVALLGWVREAAAAFCSPPFQDVPYSTGYYCAKCDTTCSTCLGSAINQCSTCPTDFTLNANSNTCAAPISSTVETIANMYHSFNFISEWANTATQNCGTVTFVKPLTASGSVITYHYKLAAHYQVRIRVAFWSIATSARTLGVLYSDLNSSYSYPNTSSATVNSNFLTQSYTASCTNAYAINHQLYIDDSATNPQNVSVTFTSSAPSWGVNQYIFIIYKCSQPDCASCVGPSANQCNSCADTNKRLYVTPGRCECNHLLGYYAYPTGNSTYYCVKPCPNLPSGQYYGDSSTRNCVLNCPVDITNTNYWNLTFASDVDNLCVKQCAASIRLGGTDFPLYYDLVGKRCTTKCPSGQPYSFYQNRACYANCPANSSGVQYYNLDLDHTCVASCPMVTNSTGGNQIPLFKLKVTTTGATGGVAYIYVCVEVCPTSTYGYTDANGVRECVSSCPNPQFADNSTGRPICRAICAKPNWFGNIPPATCVTTCPSGFFGDQNDPNGMRQCVSKCNGSYYGLPNGGQCVSACPDGMWGQSLDLICVSYVYQCDPTFKRPTFTFASTILPNVPGAYPFYPADGMAFADDFSHKCVWANQACSMNQYKLNSTSKCVLTCPTNTYAHPLTFWCVDFCYGVYFADPQLNQCVKVCSPGLFADKGSSNKCVTRCNQTGGYPYRDSDLRQCVSVCSNGYADPIAQSCVFNCTPGLYLNGSDQSNQTYKICSYNCTSPYFAYNNTDSGICVQTCPEEPILFGDTVGGLRICVQVCTMGTYGDQTNNSYRHCVAQCPNNTYAQNDTLRRCVTRCKTGTYGTSTNWTCVDPLYCPSNYTGDPTTNLCVNWCPTANGTFADNISKLCVLKCPNDNGTLYYADQHIRWCIPTCFNYNASVSEFGNNSTQTCEPKCLDNNSFADAQSPRRYCIAVCTNTNTTKYYRNNRTMTCVVSTGCPTNLFADNLTAYCVSKCSLVTDPTNASLKVQTWGYRPTQTCVTLCPGPTFGDSSTGIPLCVQQCADLPVPKWSYLGPGNDSSVMLCMQMCPPPYFGEDYFRSCVEGCPRETTTAPIHKQTYSYDVTRRCLLQCPNNTFADYIQGICYHSAINCTIPCAYTNTSCSTYRWGDPYNNSCTFKCTATPWETYGDNTTQTCTTKCATASYADNFTGTRTCIAQCPGYYTIQGVVKTNFVDIWGDPYDSYGDNFTQRCVKRCLMPLTYADWQSHLCALRCTGDNNTTVPTYANIFNRRCVISLFCPTGPDLYFGENITRMCQPSCPYYNFSQYNSATNSSFYNPFYFNASFYNASFYNTATAYVSFADNITRSCIPDCYLYYNATNNVTTRFYGDVSKTRPVCVIACPSVPRLFGRNDTFRCVAECPDYQYGDQTGNRSCVPVCPLINGVTWFSQLTERICVVVCEDGTWGNYYNSSGPHCETVGTDCKPGQFGDNSTHLCVDLCPESMNYFGDPSTRLCTTKCPFLNSSLFNSTANINLTAGRLFADYKTRICVYTCPLDFGLQGTFGDNSTNTCVERCPNNTYGDAKTANRFCVAMCTGGAFADPYTMLCVDVCPASPPLYGYDGNWTCVQRCPSGLWADDTTRTCVSDCNPGYRLTTTNECVGVCPAQLDLYGDSNGYNCVASCTNGQYADPTDRTCTTDCTPLFQYNYRCVKYCPKGFFADSNNNCVPPLQCDGGTFGDNDTTQCVSPCPGWSFADSASGYCIAICPTGTYGENHICQPDCTITNTSASNVTQQCMSKCPNGTYSLLGQCVANCTGVTYQREDTRICDTICATSLWADPNSHRCVKTCPYNWFRQKLGGNSGYCVAMNGGCQPYFADFYTGDCVVKCSTGYWGFGDSANSTNTFVGNYSCLRKCPPGLYGYDDGTERNCYPPNGLPIVVTLFADTISGQFVAECPQLPLLYYGDVNRQLCVARCQSFNLTANVITLYYGDPQARQCKSSCSNSTYSADNVTRLCTLKCSLGTFRYNSTPVCVNPCFVGYGDHSTRICVAVCPQSAATFGFYNTTSGSRMCLNQCPLTYYAEPIQRTCTALCPKIANDTIFYYAYNDTRECLLYCKGSFADNSNQRCVKECLSSSFPNADNSTNRCVPVCPSTPDYYADNHVCVFYCVTPNTFADSNGRICTSSCSNISANQYGDPRTGRCEVNCSEGTWGDNSTNRCVPVCPDGSFADNTTGKCVAECPKVENIYADMILHVCAYTCSNGRFGSQINQTCIEVCDNGFWGDPTTTLCISRCPVKIYSFGQNDTRTCVTSCAGYTGYADNHSRLCRQYCQHTLPVQTYIDYTTYSCVEICPQGYYAVNHSAPGETINKCSQHCDNGFADNFSQWCVSVCPDDPETYGDTTDHKCVYTCRSGEFTDNTTNLCVPICPNLLSTPPADYFGDPVTGRCVRWCTEGTYAQNDTSRLCVNPCPDGEFADNLTRRCVEDCPPSQATFADPTTHRCVRICPQGLWAENLTQTCEQHCRTYTTAPLIGVVAWADNTTNFCVRQCPFGYFGTNLTHECVLVCPRSQNQYGHFIGRVCVGTNPTTGKVDCYPDNSTGMVYYADNNTQTCVQKCPLNLWADTHIQKCVENCDASFPQYRNRHTQMCVWPCPVNPDEFGDPISGNCVRTCPNGTFASTSNRTCLSGCGEFGLFGDNTTNRCQAKCATQPYLFADNLTHLCVLHCSGGQFADNRSQTCVQVCPEQWAYFGEKITYTCVSLCPDGLFADANALRTCRTTCTNSYFADNFTSSCVQHCRFVRPFWYEDTSTGPGVCVAVCPGESYAYNPDQTCKYQDPVTFYSTCPPPYFANRISRQCVKKCPAGTFADNVTRYCQTTCSGLYYADPVLRECAPNCSANLFQYELNITGNISNLCVQYCPSTLFAQNGTAGTPSKCVPVCNTLGLPSTRTCETYCPHPYFADLINHLCVLTCNPYMKYMPTRTCLQTCLAPYYGNIVNFTCDLLCPEGYFGRNTTRRCETTCLSLSFADPSLRVCVAVCPGSPLLFADTRSNQCLDYCTSPLFAYEVDFTCRSSCPNITIALGQKLVYLADASNRKCVLQCVNAIISFADYSKNECTQFCPNGTFADNYTKECVKTCPIVPNDTFSDNTSRICMDVCLPGSFGMSSKLNCVEDCWWPFYADPISRRCVDLCPPGHFAQNSSATCRTTCPSMSYADPVTRRCLATCPWLQKFYNFDGNWTCLLSCPPGYFASDKHLACISICNTSVGWYAYVPTGECKEECPVPYRGFAPNFTCVLACPEQYYFYDVTINVCAQCDSKCVICSSLTTCLQCKTGYNLFSGYCTRSCLPSGGVITYSDPSGSCVTVCPTGWFGDNSNNVYSCVQDCPTMQFGDITTQLCQYCPPTCGSCTSMTTCLTCATAATLAIDNMCYRDCNATFKFAYNGTCYNTCPDGSYLTYTGVTCAPCGPLCLTCTGTPTTCTSCATTYYYNNTCMTTCPKGFYGSTTLQCLSCSGSNSAACTNPLSFSTSFSTQNFKPVITLQFNQNITTTKDISEILKINVNPTRRLEEEEYSDKNEWMRQRQLAVGTIVNNGITYSYEILPNGTILLYPEVGTSLISPTFSVSISDPAAVTSASTGASLQNVQSQLSVASVEFYPPEQSTKAETNFPAKLVTVLVLVLFGLTFFFSDVMIRPLQWLQILCFHCLIAVGAPPNIYYHLYQMKNSTLDFLTNWFESSLPNRSPYYSTPQKVADTFIDEIFLRHLGPFFLVAAVFGCFWFFFLSISSKFVMRHKIWQGFFQEVSRKRFQLMLVNDIFSIFYFPILFFAMMQMGNLVSPGSFYALNAAFTIILFIGAIIVPIAWATLWKIRSREEFHEKLWFLTLRIKPLGQDQQAAVVHDAHEQKSVERLKEKNSQHSKDFIQTTEQPNKNERNPRQLQSVVFLWYQTVMALWMVALYTSPTMQLGLLIATNCVFLAYHLKVRPQLNNINLIFTILAILTMILFEGLYLYFQTNTELRPTQKTNAAFPFLVAADVFCILFALWAVWRVIWEASFYWRNFKQTQLYLQFADHDYVGEVEKTSEYSLYERKAEILEAGLGDIVIDEILEKVGESGEKVIAVRKKRLRKKAKVQGRKKMDGSELLPDESAREEYVRVNQPNVFDFHEEFEEEPEQQPQPRRRVIDDDVRDMVSDEDEPAIYRQEEQEEKKIDLDPEDQMLDHIDSISAVNNHVARSERISDFPFFEVEQEEERAEEEKMGEEQEESEQAKPDFYPVQHHKEEKQPPRESPRVQQQYSKAKEEEEQQQEEEEYEQESEMESRREQERAESREREEEYEQRYQQMKSEASQLPEQPIFQQPASVIAPLQQQKSQQEQGALTLGQSIPAVAEQKAQEMESVNIEDLPADIDFQVERPKVKNIEDLLLEEELGKKKNLLFLFDDFDEEP